MDPGLLGASAALIGNIFVQRQRSLAKLLSDRAAAKRIAVRVRRAPVRIRYEAALRHCLRVAESWAGPALGLRALGVNLTASLSYSGSIFVVGWALGGPDAFGETEVFPEFVAPARLALGVVFLGSGFVIFRITRSAPQVEAWFTRVFAPAFQHLVPRREEVGRRALLVVIGTAVLCTFVVVEDGTALAAGVCTTAVVYGAACIAGLRKGTAAVASAVAGSILTSTVAVGAGAGGVVGAIAGFGAFARRGTIAVAGAGAVFTSLVILAGTVIWYADFASIYESSLFVSVTVFWLIVPIVSGVSDWLSWAISRRVGERVLRYRRRVWSILLFASLDALLAIALTCAQVAGLAWVAVHYNQLAESAGGRAPLQLEWMLERARGEPWGPDALWLTVVVVSTLVPTAIHCVIALTAFLTRIPRRRTRAALAARIANGWHDPVEVHRNAWKLMLVDWSLGAVVVAVAGAGLVAGVSAAVGPVAGLLIDLAAAIVGLPSP